MKIKLKKVVSNTFKNGGTTTPLNNKAINDGFMVSLAGTELVVPAKEFNYKVLKKYLTKNKLNKAECLGTWLNDGLVYIDKSINVKHLKSAVKLGNQNKQLAIYDIANKKVIEL